MPEENNTPKSICKKCGKVHNTAYAIIFNKCPFEIKTTGL